MDPLLPIILDSHCSLSPVGANSEMLCVSSQLPSQTLILPTSVKLGSFPNGALHHQRTVSRASVAQFFSHSFISNPNAPLLPKPSVKPLIIRAVGGHGQLRDGGNQDSGGTGSWKSLNWAKPLLNFAMTNFLPLALVSGVVVGLANPTLGCLAHRYSMSKFSTFGIFLISGLTLRSEEIGAATEAWPAAVFGLISILLLSPFLSRVILQLQMVPREFVTGLAIFTCMPTTLSSGVALTQLVGGNTALALAMTVVSNLLGILIVPILLSNLIADGAGVTVPTGQLFKGLVTTLLVPLILGKISRDYINEVAEYVDQNRKLLSMTSAVLLSLVPWMQVSKSRSLLLMVQPIVFLVAIVMGLLLHFILLILNALSAWCLSMISGGRTSVFAKKENFRVLVMVTSQKTLPVMVAVVEQLRGAFGESGLLILPCVAAHINQIIFDSFLVSFWLRKDQSSNALKEA